MVFMYLMILTLVGVAIFALLYLYYQDKGLYTTDIEKYDLYAAEIVTLSKEYSHTLETIDALHKEQLGNGENYTDQIANIDKRKQLHEEAKVTSTRLITLNEDILELELDQVKHQTAKATIEAAYTAIDDHNAELAKLEDQLFVSTYLLTLDNSLKCYASIDTVNNSSSIESSVTACDNEIDSALDMLHARPENFERSKAYLNEVKNYWDITIELNKTIEKRDEETALKLSENLEKSSSERNRKQNEAEAEFQEYVNSLEN